LSASSTLKDTIGVSDVQEKKAEKKANVTGVYFRLAPPSPFRGGAAEPDPKGRAKGVEIHNH